MADQKISELTALTGANVADDDAIAIVDTSATETKKIVFSELKNALDTATGFVRITGDTMTGALDVQSTITSDGLTVDTNTLHVDATNNRVGIGTTSPSAPLQVQGSAGEIRLQRPTASQADWSFKLPSSGGELTFYDNNNSSEAMRIDSSGRVKIGTTSNTPAGDGVAGFVFGDNTVGTPAAGVASFAASSSAPLLLTRLTSDGNVLGIADGTTTRGLLRVVSGNLAIQGNNNLVFSTGGSNTEAMRIDSSGTVLVGKTASNSDVVGVEAAQDGHVYVTVNNTLPLYINRQSGDEMLRFASNGATVGSITSVGGSDIKLVLSSDGDQYITGNAASNYMTFSAANAERMRIDSSGNLLVGRTSTINGNTNTTSGTQIGSNGLIQASVSGDTALALQRLTTDGDIIQFRKDTTTVGKISSVNSSRLKVSSNDVQGYFFLNNGTANASNKLWLNGSLLAWDDSAYDIGSSTTKFKDLHLSGSIEIENGTKNVGVGKQALNSNTASENTAVGYQALYTTSTGGANTALGDRAGFSVTNGTGNTFIGQGSGYSMTGGSKNTILGSYNGNENGLDIRTSSNNIVLSDGDGNPRGIFDGSGNFGVGITPTVRLHVYGTAGNYNSIFRNGSDSGQGVGFQRADGTQVGSITWASSTVSFNQSSDHRLKENVVELTDATTRLKQLEPKRFNFIADADTTVDGFIAHEVQTVVPEAISGTKDAVDADGNPEYQGIDQSKLVPLLVATIKELEARITALENA